MASRTKVLWLTKGLDKGGAEVIMCELAAHPALSAFEIHVGNVLSGRDQLSSVMGGLGVTVHHLGATSTMDLRWIMRLGQLLRAQRFDVVHSHSPLPAAVARILGQLVKPRPYLLCTEHSAASLYHPLTRLLNDVTAFLDDRRFVVSADAAKTRRWFHAKAPEVVRHGRAAMQSTDVDAAKLRICLGWGEEHVVVISVANLRPEKNTVLLVDAFAALAREVAGARLLLVGDGPERERIERRIALHRLESRVKLCGYRADARELLYAADIFALSSNIEGLPMAVIEAMQAGLPVVATDVGGLREAISHGEEGFLSPSGDALALAAGLKLLAQSARVRHELGRKAQVKGTEFSITPAAELTRTAYLRAATRD